MCSTIEFILYTELKVYIPSNVKRSKLITINININYLILID